MFYRQSFTDSYTKCKPGVRGNSKTALDCVKPMTAGDILKQPVLTRESIVHLPSDTCQTPLEGARGILNLFQNSTCEPSLVIFGDILRCLLKLSGYLPATRSRWGRGSWKDHRGRRHSPRYDAKCNRSQRLAAPVCLTLCKEVRGHPANMTIVRKIGALGVPRGSRPHLRPRQAGQAIESGP